jgi:hypothetical protein
MMPGRIVGTAGESGSQQQRNQQDAIHRLSIQNDNNGNEAPRVYPQFASDDVAVSSLPPPILLRVTYYKGTVACHRRLPWMLNRSQVWSDLQ